ncbi:MAG: bifunctional DNA primase/polymerase [Thermogemmata sp.]
MSELLQAALELAELGYAVLPLRPGEKVPLLQGGYKIASTEPKTIREWWSRRPDANVGISTSHLIVIDLDAPAGLGWPDDGPLNQELQDRAGAVVRSPRGGLHLYFATQELAGIRCSAGQLGEGVDVRAVGGHIVTPPSRTANGRYEWLRKPPPCDELPEPPVWLLERLAEQPRPPAPVAAVSVSVNGAALNGTANGHITAGSEGARIPEGRRKTTLVALAGKLRDKGMSLEAIRAALITENRTRCTPPLPESEVEDILRSAARWRPGHLPAPADDGDVCLAELQEREVDWLWPDRFPLGFVSLLAGRQGLGKSLLALDIAGRITTGSPWPDGSGVAPQGGVVIVNLEDDAARVLKPRLRAAGADVNRVRAVTTPLDTFEVERAARIIDRTPDCRLLIIDPIGNHLGAQTDASRDNAVRAALSPLAELAKEKNLAILVVAHLRKAAADAADSQVLGSVAFTALARAVWHVLPGEKPHDGERVLASGKMNLARPAPGLEFRITGTPPVLAWGGQLPPERTADVILAEQRAAKEEAQPGRPPTELQEATEFLEVVLRRGPLSARDIFAQARAAGIAQKTLHRAKARLGIRPRQMANGWVWALPGWKPAPEAVAQLFDQ